MQAVTFFIFHAPAYIADTVRIGEWVSLFEISYHREGAKLLLPKLHLMWSNLFEVKVPVHIAADVVGSDYEEKMKMGGKHHSCRETRHLQFYTFLNED